MTMGELRALLGPIQATIVDGPSALGAYTLAVPLKDHATVLDAFKDALNTLRAHERVTLAEPILRP